MERFSRLGLKARIGGSFAVSMLVILAVVIPSLMLVISGLIDRAIERQAATQFDIFRGMIEAETERAASLAHLVALMPEVGRAMAAGDRELLARSLVPGFKTMADQHGIEQVQFHLPPATSFLRVHQPAKFGDDLSSFRRTVVEANVRKQPVTGLEKGVAGLGLRAVEPITLDGRHLGTVEFGTSVGQPLVDRFKKRCPECDLSLFVAKPDGGFAAFASTLASGGGAIAPATGVAELQGALGGHQTIRRLDLGGRPRAILVAALTDYSGAPAAAMELMIDVGELVASQTHATVVAALALVAALLLAVGLLYLIHRTVTRPLVAVTGVMEALAAGDLGVVVPPAKGRDEISQMARAVAVFKDNMVRNAELSRQQLAEQEARRQRTERIERFIAEFDAAMSSVVNGVASAATQLQSDAQTLSATAEQTSRQANTVAGAAEQASGNVGTVAAATEELTASVGEISRQVTESSRFAANAVGEANRTNETVAGLSEAAQKIGEVVQLINDIASQTNLLALNATIEAARAGDAGKGFAVVATEVKNLANQTAKATEDIQKQVGQMQAVTGSAVEAIRDITGTIRRMSEIAATIASAVDQQGAATHEIARNVQQASSCTQEVSVHIGDVTQAAASTGAMAGQTLSAAQDLARQAERLRSEVDGFVGRVRAA